MRERGSVTAEFAAALPAAVIVLACCLAGMQVAGQQVRLQDAAAIAARSVARGETNGVALGRARQLASGARLAVSSGGELVCATLEQRAGGPSAILQLDLEARSCALGEGQ